MKLYLISQNKNTGWDTYDSAVVCADNEEDAKNMHPSNGNSLEEELNGYHSWVLLKDVKIEYIGEAKEGLIKSVICASFNAG